MKETNRLVCLTFSAGLLIFVGFLIGLMLDLAFGGGLNTYIVAYILWAALLGFTPLINRFFINVPKNSGAVIQNMLYTYKPTATIDELTKLQPTDALREVGPGIQGILLWEKVGWIIDLGKRIKLNSPITAYTKDNIEVNIEWQVILTPLRTFLVNLVRHDDDTVQKFFDGKCRSAIIEMVSQEYAQSTMVGGVTLPSIFEKISHLKDKFKNLFGGAGHVHDDEREYGAFTNDPQLTNIKRSSAFQKAVEALQISTSNAEAVNKFKNHGLSPKAALIGTLASQNLSTEGLFDVDLNVKGLKKLKNLSFVGTPPLKGKPTDKKTK